MNTQISEIGKKAALDKLFEGSGYVNESPIILKEKGECCTAHRIMLEGVDFDVVFNPLKHLGYKAVLYVLGDIYAALRKPVSLSVDLAVSNRFSFEDICDLFQGMITAAKEHKVKHFSFDLLPSAAGMCISLSACGVQKKGVLEQIPPSKKFDLICLSGDLGAAYMGLHVLNREKVAFESSIKNNPALASEKQPDLSQYKFILEQYLCPEIKEDIVDRFVEAGIFPSKGFFIAHGLADAIKTLSQATGFGAKIYLEKIPIASKTFEMAQELNMDAITAAMNGGDDYKFIFTISIEKNEIFKKEFQDFDIIGHLARPEVGTVLVTPEGAEIEIKAPGWK